MSTQDEALETLWLATIEERYWRDYPLAESDSERLDEANLRFHEVCNRYSKACGIDSGFVDVEAAKGCIDEIADDPLLSAFWRYYEKGINERIDDQVSECWQQLAQDILLMTPAEKDIFVPMVQQGLAPQGFCRALKHSYESGHQGINFTNKEESGNDHTN